MVSRMIAAGIALLGASCLAAPLAISAGPNVGVSAGVNQRAAPSLPLVDPGKPIPNPPSPPQSGGHHHFAFRSPRGHEPFEPGTPFWWGYAGYAPAYYPQLEVAPVAASAYEVPPQERSRPQVFYQPGCRVDAVTVPSESGGMRTINITRCY
jgi:hypothetical protein